MSKETRNDASAAVSSVEERDPTYFGYYGMLAHQQNMLQDSVRTTAYYTAITQNRSDFAGKVVLDVGAGTGILSFFAAQAGARKVYAVEASTMARHARALVRANGLEDVIQVIEGKLESIDSLPEPVDVIISEPIGVFLVHERMIETFLHARDRFLRRDAAGFGAAQMFPSSGSICLAPFTDASLYADTLTKARFWQTPNFYGINVSSLWPSALEHFFSQPVVGAVDPRSLLASVESFPVPFYSMTLGELEKMAVPFSFRMNYTGIVHGLAGWFDLTFAGSTLPLFLSTSPSHERTHWHQVRFLFLRPIAVNHGQILSGTLHMSVNDQRSYDIKMSLKLFPSDAAASSPCPLVSREQTFLLHDQQYWNLSGGSFPDVPREMLNVYTDDLFGEVQAEPAATSPPSASIDEDQLYDDDA